MKRIRVALLSSALIVTPLASTLAIPTDHADQFDCDASYFPCDGSNLDYLDTLGDTPLPHDPVVDGLGDQPVVSDNGYLGDPDYGSSLGDPGDPPWWDARGLGD